VVHINSRTTNMSIATPHASPYEHLNSYLLTAARRCPCFTCPLYHGCRLPCAAYRDYLMTPSEQSYARKHRRDLKATP
jgi:hypothetical protein